MKCLDIEFSMHDWFHSEDISNVPSQVRLLNKKTWKLIDQKVKEENLNIERIIGIFHVFVDVLAFPRHLE